MDVQRFRRSGRRWRGAAAPAAPPAAALPVLALILPALLLSCAGPQRASRKPDPPGPPPAAAVEAAAARSRQPAESGPAGRDVEAVQAALAEGAWGFVGAQELVVRGRRFNMDCTGVVLAVYYQAEIDLALSFHKYTGNGVTCLYRTLEDEDLLYHTERPAVGDIIFWDNTYDRNGDGLWNDEFTHVGMVTRSEPDGSVEYVHFNYRKGIVLEGMNLLDPDIHQRMAGGRMVIVNAPMRMRGTGGTQENRWLASHLYRIFGQGYRVSQ